MAKKRKKRNPTGTRTRTERKPIAPDPMNGTKPDTPEEDGGRQSAAERIVAVAAAVVGIALWGGALLYFSIMELIAWWEK